MKRVLLEMFGEQTPHERCPKGKHWNDNSSKCEKIPVGVKLHIATAAEHGSRAHEDGDAADKESNPKLSALSHANAASGHAHAAKYHQTAAKHLRGAGFGQAADEHEKHSATHKAKEAEHGGKADPELLHTLKKQNPFMTK